LAHFLKELQVDTAYLSVPTRPPAEHWVQPPQYDLLTGAYQILQEEVEHVELLIGYEGNAFSSTGNSAMDLLSITAVHPMREDAVQAILKQNSDEWNTVHRLIEEKQLVELSFQGHRYYLRSLR
jgi:wyosine [tRNA(Phe)-imidazoG37] synthetase (radical SAM superfamily)